ncbi:MAG: SPFH domain-containing protein [Methylococcaceae bacterium]|nr:SPFH domain-containing protein [Methylococcaceae bacterium]
MGTFFIIAGVIFILLLLSIVVVKQGNIGVVTRFGKYHRMLQPGINLKWPLVDNVFSKISIQHRSIELEFEAISLDQASVNFKSLILFAAKDSDEETVKKIAFRFIDEKSFMQTLIRSIEGSIRAFVATKKQAEILTLRHEIVHAVVEHLEESLSHWGFHLLDLQINDISFDEAIMRSMSQVVSSNNMKAAAENEAQAQYLIKTRAAEAEARSIRVKAEAERDALELKGAGNALFREQVATGLAKAGTIMDAGQVDPALMLYTQWLDTMKNVAAHSHGNILSFDGSNDGFDKTFKQMQLINKSLLEKK